MEILINGVKTNYQVFGDGQPFLILHGWGSNSERWQLIAEKIAAKGYKVIVPDLPGFGKSDDLLIPWTLNKYVDWSDEFVKQLDLKEFYLLGHSFGGALATKIAIKHAQEVRKLFLISAAVIRKKTSKKSLLSKIAKIIKIFYFIPYYGLFRKAVYKFIIRKSDYVYVEGIMKETYLNVIAEDLSFQLPFIKTPTIIIWGDKDEFTPVENGYFVKDRIKNSKIVIIPGVGHNLNKENDSEGAPILAEKILGNI